MTINQKMAAMVALGADRTHLDFSEFTGQWYVSASIEISDGSFSSGITEHRDSPGEAVDAFWDRITSLKPGESLVAWMGGGKPDWRGKWNGFMWEPTR